MRATGPDSLTRPNDPLNRAAGKRSDCTVELGWQPRLAREGEAAKNKREAKEAADREKEASERDTVATRE